MDLTSAILRIPDGLGRYPSDAHWQAKLEAAQNVLFCKELFAQVSTDFLHKHCLSVAKRGLPVYGFKWVYLSFDYI